MRKLITLVAALSALAIGCGDDGGATTAPPVTPQPVAPTTPTTPTTPTAPAGGSNFGTVTLATGFTPDPHTATGTSGGAVNAQNLNQACRGWVASQPDHLLVASTAFSNLRILVNGGAGDTAMPQPDPTTLATSSFSPRITAEAPCGAVAWAGGCG